MRKEKKRIPPRQTKSYVIVMQFHARAKRKYFTSDKRGRAGAHCPEATTTIQLLSQSANCCRIILTCQRAARVFSLPTAGPTH